MVGGDIRELRGWMKMTCKDCLSLNVCKFANEYISIGSKVKDLDHNCKDFKDKFKFIALPCKPGDTVYEVYNNTDACLYCDEYSGAYYDMESRCDVQHDNRIYWPEYAEHPICDKQFFEVRERWLSLDQIFNNREQFGKTIFLTREEAEEDLKNMT